MAARIGREVPGASARITPGGKGDFIVDASGGKLGGEKKRLWDKRKMRDEFPDEAEIVAMLRALEG